jgi:hypothetical protein
MLIDAQVPNRVAYPEDGTAGWTRASLELAGGGTQRALAKARVSVMPGFKRFRIAAATISGIERMHRICKASPCCACRKRFMMDASAVVVAHTPLNVSRPRRWEVHILTHPLHFEQQGHLQMAQSAPGIALVPPAYLVHDRILITMKDSSALSSWIKLSVGAVLTAILALSVHVFMLSGLDVSYPALFPQTGLAGFLNTVPTFFALIFLFRTSSLNTKIRSKTIQVACAFVIYAMMRELLFRLPIMDGPRRQTTCRVI